MVPVRISRETSVGAALVGAAWLTPVVTWAQAGVVVLTILSCVALSVRRDLLLLRVVAPLASIALFFVTYYQNRSEGFFSAIVAMFVQVFSSTSERPLASFAAMVLLGASASLIQINYRRYWYATFSAAGVPFGLALSGEVRPYSLALFAVVAAAGTALTPLDGVPQSFGGAPRSRWASLPIVSTVLCASLLALGPGSVAMDRFAGSIKDVVVKQVSEIESSMPVPESLSKKLAQDASQGRITQGQLEDMLGENGLEAQLDALSQSGLTLDPGAQTAPGSNQGAAATDEQNSPGAVAVESTVIDEALGGASVTVGTPGPNGESEQPNTPGSVPANPTTSTASAEPSNTSSTTAGIPVENQVAPGGESESQSGSSWPVVLVVTLLFLACVTGVLMRRRTADVARASAMTPVVAAWARADERLSLVAGRREAGVSFIERHHEIRQSTPDLTQAHAELSLLADAEFFGGELPRELAARAEELSFELQEGSSKRARREAARSYKRDQQKGPR